MKPPFHSLPQLFFHKIQMGSIIKWGVAVLIFLLMFKVTDISDSSTSNDPVQWAMLVAGGENLADSFAFENDVAETFDLLKTGGLKEENIVVFSYDNVETHPDNPFRGKRRPYSYKNYYAALKKDYTGHDVTYQNIIDALSGRREGVGYRKVISSGSRDTVFLVISAHGSPKRILIDKNVMLEKRRLMEAIISMKRERKFGSLLMYVSSCHGSCVIEKTIFPEDSRILVITSSYCHESALASSCDRFNSPSGKEVKICSSTDFHRTWIKHSNASNRQIVDVLQQYREIKSALAKPVTGYIIGGDGTKVLRSSNAANFGDKMVIRDKLEKFQGFNPQWHQNRF